MKAAQYQSYGDSSVVHINPDAPEPVLKIDQVLIAIYAASFNPFDTSIRKGMMQKMMPLPFPITAGGDFAGVIKGTNEEVYGSANVANGGSGSFAEFAATSPASMAPKPKNISFEEAAALPLVGSSTVQALEEHMHLAKGQKVLIHGGAGGIGHMAIQLAKHIGAYVATTVRTKDVEFVRSLGADEVIDFTKEDFATSIKDFDAVFDTVGGDIVTKSFAVLKKGGILVSMKGQPDTVLAAKFGVQVVGQGTKTNTEHLNRVSELVNQGALHVHIDKTFSLDQVVEAWKYQDEGHPQGKVVLTVTA